MANGYIQRTATHQFWIAINRYGENKHVAYSRPLNPKTGKPWQAMHRIEHEADIEPHGYEGRPIAYSTIERAQAAIDWQIGRLAKRKAA